MILSNAANILRKAGLDVHEMPGWRDRANTSGAFHPLAIMYHHDGMGLGWNSNPADDLNVPINMARPDQFGAQFWVSRFGLWVMIAAGRMPHAGVGAGRGRVLRGRGNELTAGMETDHRPGNPWPAAQLAAINAGTKALVTAYGWSAPDCLGHKEYAPGRKTDPEGIDLGAWRVMLEGGAAVLAPKPQRPGKSYIVQPGDTLWKIAQRVGATTSQIAALSGLADPNLIVPGQRLTLPEDATRPPAAKPAPPANAPVKRGPMYGVPVPALIRKGSGQYFGSITGPAASHGGYHISERSDIRLVQRQLIYTGCVPGVTDTNSGWADGIWDTRADRPNLGPTSMAMARFQRKYLPHTTFYGQCWFDDWAELARH